MSDPRPADWDLESQRALRMGARSRAALVTIATRYLAARKDSALGLAPTRLLTPERSHLWVLFWAAARWVDDSVENELTSVAEWRTGLTQRRQTNFAERCLEAFLARVQEIGRPD